MDDAFTLRLFWWTQQSLIPIPSFIREIPPLDPIAHPVDAAPLAVRCLKKLVKEGLRLPPESDVFVTTGDSQTAIPDDVSVIDLASGKYGKVSVKEPLWLLVAGNWTVDTVKKPLSDFRALRREIAESGLLPRLPPVDNVGIFTAYPIFASEPDDWLAALLRLLGLPPHRPTRSGMDPSSIRHGATDFYSHEHADAPPPYEEYPPCRLTKPTSVRSRPRRGFFSKLWKFLCS